MTSVDVIVTAEETAELAALRRALERTGMTISAELPALNMLRGSVDSNLLERIGRVPGVLHVGKESAVRLPAPGQPQ